MSYTEIFERLLEVLTWFEVVNKKSAEPGMMSTWSLRRKP